jgi:hypothetical protein
LPFPEATDFAIRTSGLPPGEVDVDPQSLAEGSPELVVETQAVLSIADGLAGNVEATWTANVRVAEAPAAKVPRLNVQELPALLPGVQVQPGEELPGRKAVSCGTVSCRLTPAASRVPAFEAASW